MPKQKYNLDRNAVKELWQYYIDIQEQLIKQRSLPISIVPDKSVVDGSKLYLEVDDTDNQVHINEVLSSILNTKDFKLENGILEVDKEAWNSISKETKIQLVDKLKPLYIDLDPTTYIVAKISMREIIKHDEELTIAELHSLDSRLKESSTLEGNIEDLAACIAHVDIDLDAVKKHLFGDNYHMEKVIRKKDQTDNYIRSIKYIDSYIECNAIKEYGKKYDLRCKEYELIFKINNDKALWKIVQGWDFYNRKKQCFIFKRVLENEEIVDENLLKEINQNISDFLRDAMQFCHRDEIEYHCNFSYTINNRKLAEEKMSELEAYISTLGEGYSLQMDENRVGIDFDWRRNDLQQKIEKIENGFENIHIIIREDHKFKCKVNVKLRCFDEIETRLKNKYNDIIIENNNENGSIHIKLPYTGSSYDFLLGQISQDLIIYNSLHGIIVNINKQPLDKVILTYKDRSDTRIEELKNSIKEMRKVDFGIEYDGREQIFGKLIKVNYPKLTLDINETSAKAEKIRISLICEIRKTGNNNLWVL